MTAEQQVHMWLSYNYILIIFFSFEERTMANLQETEADVYKHSYFFSRTSFSPILNS